MNKHLLMNKHAKIDVPSRRVQDERQLFAAQIRAGRAVLGWSQTDLGERPALPSVRSIGSKMARRGRDN